MGGNGFVSRFPTCFVLGKDAVAGPDTGDGFVAVCRFDQGVAMEGAGVGFLKNLVLNILFQMKEIGRLKTKFGFQTTFYCWFLNLIYVCKINSFLLNTAPFIWFNSIEEWLE